MRPPFKASRPFYPAAPVDRLVEEAGYLLLSPTIVANRPQDVLDDETLLKSAANELGIGSNETYWRIQACLGLQKRLEELPAPSASGLRGWNNLRFANLRALSFESAQALVPLRRPEFDLHAALPLVGELEPRVLGELASFAGKFTLGIPQLEVPHTLALQQWAHREQPYDFTVHGIAPGGAAAEVLFWNRPVRLYLESPPDYASCVAITEAKHQARSFLSIKYTDGGKPMPQLRALESFEGGLGISSLEEVSPAEARAFAAIEVYHLLIGSEYLSRHAASILSFSKAHHLVVGADGMEEGALEALLEYDGPLLAWGPTRLSERAVRLISERSAPVSLPTVKSLSDSHALLLRDSHSPVELGKNTRLGSQMRILLNEEGYGAISFARSSPELVELIPVSIGGEA
ncbi:MAG: hypothetical protein WCO60_16920 [Verrucomicrobiota bacterium]